MDTNDRLRILEEQTLALNGTITQLQGAVNAQGVLIERQRKQLAHIVSGKKEAHYQALLEKQLDGTHLTIPGVGRTDITTADAHVEIKRWTRFHEVPGQLAKYQSASPRSRSCVYFFGLLPAEERLRQITALMHSNRIEMFSVDEDDAVVHYPIETQNHVNDLDSLHEAFIAECLVITGNCQHRIHQRHLYEHFDEWLTNKKQTQHITRDAKTDLKNKLSTEIGVQWVVSIRVTGVKGNGPGFHGLFRK